jgi:hypothetical protein
VNYFTNFVICGRSRAFVVRFGRSESSRRVVYEYA